MEASKSTEKPVLQEITSQNKPIFIVMAMLHSEKYLL
jgi:hypothetical protein